MEVTRDVPKRRALGSAEELMPSTLVGSTTRHSRSLKLEVWKDVFLVKCVSLIQFYLFSSSNFTSLNYFSNIVAEIFYWGHAFYSHGGSASTSVMQQLNFSAEFLCCTNFAIKIHRPNFRGAGVTFKQQIFAQTKEIVHFLKEDKSYLHGLGLHKGCKVKLMQKISFKWGKPNGLFIFSWFHFLNCEIKESFLNKESFVFLQTPQLIGFHPSVVGGTIKKIFKTSHTEVAWLIPSSESSRCPCDVS